MNKIQQKIENGYHLESNKIYDDTFDIYKKMAVPAGAILFLLVILFGGIYTLTLFTIFKNPTELEQFFQSLALLELSPEILAYYIFASAVLNGLMSIFGAGLIKMAHDVYHNQLPKFSTPFIYFTKIEGIKIFMFTIVVQIIYNAISLGLETIGLSMVGIFIMVLINLLTLLVVPFIIFDKMPIFKALEASVSLINQKPFKILMYLILLGLLSLSGVFMFIIGIIFTLPIIYCFNFSIYENIINKN